MDELRPTDPARIGAHRLLGRLGAGGMGVVYLGRTDAGATAAIKVILPEYAGDDEFRTRFRREVEAARKVRSPWAVAVIDAETEGERPWLATAFVPGPSLAEAVASCGPMPLRSVRVLAGLLSRALTAVHTAGLVHRDVKPGNVLLTADGPRLIDFGIARAGDATALTATDLVVGTPGFLSPEQASGGGTVPGPASDVFSLGCLLAYAATGRPPYGSGAVDALLYRTVHDEPDLDGIDDAELRALLADCLVKNPADRPTARQLDERIVEDASPGSVEWLPEDVVRLIADRSAAMLALPGIEPTIADEPAPGPPGRRRFLSLAAAGAVVVAGGGAFAAWEALRDDEGAGGAKSGERAWIIGVQADLSGARKAAGKAQERGARVAVERFNSRKDKPYTLQLKVLDDRGDPARAVKAAEEFARDRDVLAVIGPTGDAETGAVLSVYDEAMLPLITVSSLAIAYAPRSKKSFFQASPSYVVLTQPIITRLVLRPDVERLGVLLDRAGGLAAYTGGYGANLLTPVLTTGTTYPRVVPAGARDLGPVIADMLANKSDALFYAGDEAGAARTAQALAATPFEGPRMAMHTAMGPGFIEEAGDAATGWEFTAPYTDATAPAAKEFAAAHRRSFGSAPAHWAAEAFDVAGLVIDALGAFPERPSRTALVARIARSTYKGISRTYAFDEKQILVGKDAYLYRVENGRYRFVGPAPKAGS
ncbi:bifunctional serine/threonine-protein kinase/ABC transporter substrate-binding protein [Streptomyces sp. NBC_01102]|uniref:bifunctional serine/threonine-protein kinase/ABC transporter substrate-binding protein n=1 Tax=Streptomyces sp. NBC_01102 TaxID=2903749 RepID=UPI00386665D6|nr:bifunctional serine/threonine-protein kinase/ABC transporter substrate-binding protein [Streptomyces sp. NBC_01102]